MIPPPLSVTIKIDRWTGAAVQQSGPPQRLSSPLSNIPFWVIIIYQPKVGGFCFSMGHLKALIKEINLRRVCLCCSLFSSATNYQFLPDSLRTLIYQLSLGNVFVLDLSKQGIKVLPSCFALMWCCQVVTLNKVPQVLSIIVKIIKSVQQFATKYVQKMSELINII